ncbi:MAG: fibronectin type III domain-containing protein [Candidatus Pacearchaeota archaeon]
MNTKTRNKKASILLTALIAVTLLGLLSTLVFIVNKKIAEKELDVFDNYGNLSTDQIEQTPLDQSTSSFSFSNTGASVSVITSEEDKDYPNSIRNLRVSSKGTTWIYWVWDNPRDSDFDKCIVYINGVKKIITSNNYYNATGLMPDTEYTITVHTRDKSGNVNEKDVSSTARTLPSSDNQPPTSITNLDSPLQGENWIYWTWTNPTDPDFKENIIRVEKTSDNSVLIETSTPDNYFNATGLLPNTEYKIIVHTIDFSGNINDIDITNVTVTQPDNTFPRAVTNLRVVMRTATSLMWEWTNPTDYDFLECRINITQGNTILKNNERTTKNYYLIENLKPNTEYTIKVWTVDTSNHENTNNVQNTTRTCALACNAGKCWEYC